MSYGLRLQRAGFRPLPDVDDAGQLLGVRQWRVRDGLVETLALRRPGLAWAVRAVAEYDYRRPFDHGPILDSRFEHALHAFAWLIDVPSEVRRSRAYLPPMPVEEGDLAEGRAEW